MLVLYLKSYKYYRTFIYPFNSSLCIAGIPLMPDISDLVFIRKRNQIRLHIKKATENGCTLEWHFGCTFGWDMLSFGSEDIVFSLKLTKSNQITEAGRTPIIPWYALALLSLPSRSTYRALYALSALGERSHKINKAYPKIYQKDDLFESAFFHAKIIFLTSITCLTQYSQLLSLM